MPVCLQWLGSVFPRRLRRNAQKRGLAWYSVPCVTCCPMYADGDADALWRGIPCPRRGNWYRGAGGAVGSGEYEA